MPSKKSDKRHKCFLFHLVHLILSMEIFIRQYRIILSADTVSEVRQMLSQKRR